jgi:hypothetical protein
MLRTGTVIVHVFAVKFISYCSNNSEDVSKSGLVNIAEYEGIYGANGMNNFACCEE